MARHQGSRFVRLADRLDVGSRAEANEIIRGGRVMVNGIVTRNPRTLVAPNAAVTMLRPRTLRGTIKLRAALAHFGVAVANRVCLDVGAAAGGFTAALLEAGARRVYAVDTGYGQLQGGLRQDSRVVNMERVNLRDLGPDLVPEPVEVLCVDLSYVALADALPQLETVDFEADTQLIALVKPTFELGSGSAVVDGDAVAKAQALASSVAESSGWSVRASVPAPATGEARTPEVFIYGRRAQD